MFNLNKASIHAVIEVAPGIQVLHIEDSDSERAYGAISSDKPERYVIDRIDRERMTARARKLSPDGSFDPKGILVRLDLLEEDLRLPAGIAFINVKDVASEHALA